MEFLFCTSLLCLLILVEGQSRVDIGLTNNCSLRVRVDTSMDRTVLANLNVFQTGFTVGVEVTTWPQVLYKRQVIFTITDLLVAVGGAAGLFLGFSVLGAIEFFYYFTLRLICYLRGYRT